ncbi:recombinase family protein [Pontiellaceae bacterium B12219]|nr:recombinase family protein [Pontiellaceae bacterium B12219]
MIPLNSIPVIIYARKSTDAKLEQQVNSISVQCDSALSYIESRKHLGWYALEEKLIDNNISGATMKRGGIERLKQLILAGKVKVVVVNRLDRISRSLSQFLDLMAFFEKYSVALVSVTQNINTGDAMGRLMLQIIMGFAEFERELICERVTERMHAARRNGQFIGGRPVLGYNIVPEGRALVTDEMEAIRVREIFGLYLELRSVKAVVRELERRKWHNKKWVTRQGKVTGGNSFSTSSLYNLLTNPVYVGKVKLKDEVFDGQHDGIVDPDVFEQVQTLLSENTARKGSRKRNSHDALLKGLLVCSACNAPFTHTYTTKKNKLYRYYTCSSKRMNGAHVCPSPSIPAGEIENLVTEQLLAIGTDADLQDLVYEQLTEAIDNKKANLASQKMAARQQLKRLDKELVSSREFEAPMSLIRHLEEKRREAVECLENAETGDIWHLPSRKEITGLLRDMQGLWPTFNTGEKCAFVKTLVRQVEYDAVEGNITLHFNEDGFIPGIDGGES